MITYSFLFNKIFKTRKTFEYKKRESKIPALAYHASQTFHQNCKENKILHVTMAGDQVVHNTSVVAHTLLKYNESITFYCIISWSGSNKKQAHTSICLTIPLTRKRQACQCSITPLTEKQKICLVTSLAKNRCQQLLLIHYM